jgi:hypothetical protein
MPGVLGGEAGEKRKKAVPATLVADLRPEIKCFIDNGGWEGGNN